MIVAKLNMKYHRKITETFQYISEVTQAMYVVAHQEMNENIKLGNKSGKHCTPVEHVNNLAFISQVSNIPYHDIK